MEAVQSFINYLQFEKRYSILTVQAYQKDLEQFFYFINSSFGSFDIKAIKHTQIRAWLASLKENSNSAKTINRKISCLKSFFKFLLIKEVILELPTNKIISPKNEKRLPSYIQTKQMDQLLDDVSFETSFKGKTNRLIIELLYNTGMRRAELKNLKTKQIEFSTQLIRVIGKGNKERLIPLVNSLSTLIQDYIKEKESIEMLNHDFLMVLENGKPLYDKYIYLVVTKYLGLVTGQVNKSPHVLRHTFATHILENGAQLNAVKELLGHQSLAATQIYTHNSIEKLKKTFEKAHPKA